MTALRIYADFNGLVRGPRNQHREAVVLDTFGSLRDLSNLGVVLSEGLPLIAVDASDEVEDLEGHGTAEYDRTNKWWVVEFDEIGVRYVTTGPRVQINKFLCVQCRAPFPDPTPAGVLKKGSVCASCGTSPLAAYAEPSLGKK